LLLKMKGTGETGGSNIGAAETGGSNIGAAETGTAREDGEGENAGMDLI
jgi:hypothetical protein